MSDVKDDQTAMNLGADTGNLESVEKFQFAPIKGYPMLNWRGKRPFTSTQFYPAQLKEVHGEEIDGWRNKIFWGDNLQVMSHLLKEFRGKVDLIYIDPPFDSKADYKRKIEIRGRGASNDTSSFEEKQYTDIWNNDEYLQFMFERLVLARELLAKSGTIFLHCDHHKSHHLRCIIDEVFGAENFLNEIVWKYAGARTGKRFFGRKHDTIFWYAKEIGQHTFNYDDVRDEYSPTTLARNKYSNSGSSTRVLNYKPNEDGKFPEDVWNISIINPFAKERVDYPTQKPEALLEKVILAASNPNDIILDFFMGSATTQAVAMKLGRRFIGADINSGSVQTATKRLVGVATDISERLPDPQLIKYTGLEVFNVNHYDIFRNPAQAKDILIEALEIQALELSTIFDGEKDGRMVKIMPVNRISTRADLNELIAGFDYKAWDRRQAENPNRPVEKLMLVCMGHEPDLAAQLKLAASPYKIDVEVVDILRDKANLEFRRDSEAKVVIKDGELVVNRFYPMNLLQKLSMQKETVEDWRELVESILIDWNYDGAILQPAVVDIPEKKTDLVAGRYKVPADAGTIRVKITDLLSESWEGSVTNG